MSSENAARAAPAETVRDPLECDRRGSAIEQEITKSPRRRQAQRGPASVYAGRELLGHVKPAKGGYVAFAADGKRLDLFERFNDATAAVMALGDRASTRGPLPDGSGGA
jgi:hypothetical protein